MAIFLTWWIAGLIGSVGFSYGMRRDDADHFFTFGHLLGSVILGPLLLVATVIVNYPEWEALVEALISIKLFPFPWGKDGK